MVLTAVLSTLLIVLGLPRAEWSPPYRIDLDVYRLGAQAFLDGLSPYGRLPDTQQGTNLPFTYPPIAAVLFVPLAVLPYSLANAVLSIASVGCFWLVIVLVARELCPGHERSWPVAGAYAVLLWASPVTDTVSYGQINLILMALVCCDAFLGRGRRWRGALTGLAIAIKLTPAVFLAYFLVRRDWRALAVASGSTLACTALGFMFAPQDSLTYWTHTVGDTSRIGGLAYSLNQSINGLLNRIGLESGGYWFVICAALGLFVLVVARRLAAQGDDLGALLALATYSLLASPVSWAHHWVWAGPALMLVFVRGWRARSPWALALGVLGIVVFAGRFPYLVPRGEGRELSWTWYEHVLGNASLWWGLAFVAALASGLLGPSNGSAPASSEGTVSSSA